MDERPWDVEPAMDRQSLDDLGRRLLEIRDTVSAQHDTAAGDGAWSLGCRAYERTINVLEQDAIAKRYGFLSIKRLGLYCAIYVNDVPVRFFRGEPENVPNRHLQAGIAEQQMLPGFAPEQVTPLDADWCWMAVIQTDSAGKGIAVTYFQADDAGQRRYEYTVAAGVFDNVKPLARPGVDLGPPPVAPKNDAGIAEIDAKD